MKILALGDRQMVTLFRMSGVDGIVVDYDENGLSVLKEILKDKTVGLLVITEKLAQSGADLISKIRFSKSQLLIVEVPDKDGHIETGKSLADYIREAVGIRI